MDKVFTMEETVRESSEAFIQRLSDFDDNFDDVSFPDYAIEIEIESYDP